TAGNWRDILINSAAPTVAAVGMTGLIVAGAIHISIGSMLAVCAVAAGLTARAGWPLALVAAVTLAAGMAPGTLNGLLVARAALHRDPVERGQGVRAAGDHRCRHRRHRYLRRPGHGHRQRPGRAPPQRRRHCAHLSARPRRVGANPPGRPDPPRHRRPGRAARRAVGFCSPRERTLLIMENLATM